MTGIKNGHNDCYECRDHAPGRDFFESASASLSASTPLYGV
jgi:hypothetical protein